MRRPFSWVPPSGVGNRVCSRRTRTRPRSPSRPPPTRSEPWPPVFTIFAGEDLIGDELLPRDIAGEVVLQPVRELEGGLRRHLVDAGEERGRAFPADLDRPEEVGLRGAILNRRRAGNGRPRRRSEGRGWKRTRVPRRFGRARSPDRPCGTPAVDLAIEGLVRATSTSSASESAFTTETPTPCRPPDVS
jgi:hypothetical protein